MQSTLDNFLDQARACEELGSPFSARLCRLLPEVLDESTRFGRTILGWTGNARADALALRACGALHALRRGAGSETLGPVYPPAQPSDTMLFGALAEAIRQHDVFLASYLDSPPQTNEVARSAIILAGMMEISRRTGQPLETLEIGASAGLNLSFADYGYDLGPAGLWGEPKAPLTIACDWRGKIPELVPVQVVARTGCDRNPLDPGNSEHVARLASYVWPDQPDRLERLDRAVAHAAAHGVRIEYADAAEWLERKLRARQRDGVTRVVYHTIVWQYLPQQVAERAARAIAQAGAEATEERPFAHLAVEADERPNSAGVRLTLWPTGTTHEIARADFHGRWVEFV